MGTSKLETARGTMARILRASAAITKENRPRGYQDFTRQEMDAIMRKPLNVEDYDKADRIMSLLMKTQVRTFFDSQPGGKQKVKGMFTFPDDLNSRPTIGPDSLTNIKVNSSKF